MVRQLWISGWWGLDEICRWILSYGGSGMPSLPPRFFVIKLPGLLRAPQGFTNRYRINTSRQLILMAGSDEDNEALHWKKPHKSLVKRLKKPALNWQGGQKRFYMISRCRRCGICVNFRFCRQKTRLAGSYSKIIFAVKRTPLGNRTGRMV